MALEAAQMSHMTVRAPTKCRAARGETARQLAPLCLPVPVVLHQPHCLLPSSFLLHNPPGISEACDDDDDGDDETSEPKCKPAAIVEI